MPARGMTAAPKTPDRPRNEPGTGETIVAVVIEYLPILMFVALGLLLFSGYPVAFVLGVVRRSS